MFLIIYPVLEKSGKYFTPYLATLKTIILNNYNKVMEYWFKKLEGSFKLTLFIEFSCVVKHQKY